MLEIPLEPAVRHDDRDRRAEIDDQLAERAEAVGDELAAEQGTGVLRLTAERRDRAEQQRDRRPAAQAASAPPEEGRDHHQHDRADRQDEFGKDWSEVHQCASATGVSAWAAARAGLPAVRCASPAGLARSTRSSSRPMSARIGRMKLSG